MKELAAASVEAEAWTAIHCVDGSRVYRAFHFFRTACVVYVCGKR